MNSNFIRRTQICVVLLLVCAFARAGEPAPSDWRTVNVLHTNQSTRVITNVIEVRVPNNVFVNEYRTNWFQRTVTNTVDVAVTNWTTLVLTNRTMLTLTNWETVVVTRTNWIPQPMTNVIEVNVPVSAAVAAKEAPVKPQAKAEAPPVESKAEALVLETLKTARPLENNSVEVKFKVRLPNDADASLQVQWRVERDDGAVLFFAQSQEFKRVLPTGHYQVLVKARRDGDSPLLTLQSGLDVMRDTVARR